MSETAPAPTAPAPPGPVPASASAPVSAGAAAVLLVAAVVAAALVSVSIARLIPFDEDDAVLEAGTPVPVEPASAVALEGVAPAVTFDGSAPALPASAFGAWAVEAGAWAVQDGVAQATETGDEGALAVIDTPAGSEIAQVTVAAPQPGAGLVVSYRNRSSYIALQVGRTGSTVQLVEVDGRRLQPRVLISADLASTDTPLVLSVRRHLGGYEAIVNGDRIGHRILEEETDPVPWTIGLTTGVRPAAVDTTYDDLVVA